MIYLMRHGVYYEHLAKLLTFLDASPDSDSIAKAVAKWNSVDLEEALAERSLMGTIVRTREEWLASPQGKHLRRQGAGRDREDRRQRTDAVQAGRRVRSRASGSSTWRMCSPVLSPRA